MKDIFAGLDIGSTTTKAVLIDPSGTVLAAAHRPTGANARKSAGSILAEAMGTAGAAAGRVVVYCTGYGRTLFEEAAARPTEIACLAMGVHHVFPSARTAIDVGGQDLKVVTVGGNGRHVNFVMNDRCAAGTGRFLEVMARVLDIPLGSIGEISLRSAAPVKVTSMCTVFAESEVISLVAQGRPVEDILAGVHESVAERIASQVGRLGAIDDLVIAGGGALNPALRSALQARLGKRVEQVPDPQRTVALGAALLALARSG